jgi:peptide/nickel transport system permease protein
MKLYEYALRRLLLLVFVLFAVSLIGFYLARGALPPEYALAPYITPKMTDSQKLALAQSLGVATSTCPSFQAFASHGFGCATPVWSQYVGWLELVTKGDWGYSQLPGLAGASRTLDVFSARFPYTAQLAIISSILTFAIAFPLGIISATRNNKLPDHVSRIVSLTGYSLPTYWFGYMLQIVFVLYLSLQGRGLLPSQGALATECAICFSSPGTVQPITGLPLLDSLFSGNIPYFWDGFVSLILPALTLSLGILSLLTRIVRSSMMEALRQDYILLARSKGLRERVVVYRHALRNAMLPAITVSGLIFSGLLGGVVLVETVFAYPGIGQALVDASLVLDINFLELYLLVTALILVVTNLGVDMIYAILDPRIRY